MLLLQVSYAQTNFTKTNDWLSNNLQSLGGRAVLVILKDGKIIYNQSQNNLSAIEKSRLKRIAIRYRKDTNEAIQNFTFTRQELVASCSKWLSAALVMTFVDEGKLSLEDTVGKFFPILSQNHKGNITIKDCLSHLTGIKGGNLQEAREWHSKYQTMGQVIDEIALLPMEGKPGQVFHYGNTGLQIAAAVIEKISGDDFETLFHQRIAVPCDMNHTDFGHKKIPLAAGGALSTPEDYIHFLQMILQNGSYNGKRVLSKESVIKMQQDYTKNATILSSPDKSRSLGYGLGEWILETGQDNRNVVSSPGLFGSFPWVDNDRQYAAFLFVLNINRKGREQKYDQLRKIIDEEIK